MAAEEVAVAGDIRVKVQTLETCLDKKTDSKEQCHSARTSKSLKCYGISVYP